MDNIYICISIHNNYDNIYYPYIMDDTYPYIIIHIMYGYVHWVTIYSVTFPSSKCWILIMQKIINKYSENAYSRKASWSVCT